MEKAKDRRSLWEMVMLFRDLRKGGAVESEFNLIG